MHGLLRGAIATGLVILLCPSAAHAATTITASSGTITIAGDAGDNRFFVEDSQDVAGQLHIAGIGEITAGTGCAGDFSDATCPGTRIVMHGADGDDELDVRTASLVSISFTGGAGNDTLGASDLDPRWADAAMTFAGGDGDDQVIGSTQPDQLDGGAGFDRLDGRGGNDAITGGDGSDTLRGGDGADTIGGGGGADLLDGGLGNDALDGGSDADVVAGGEGDDSVGGGAGDDGLEDVSGSGAPAGASIGRDVVRGGAGSDRVGYSTRAGIAAIIGGTGGDDDLGVDVETVEGSGGADTLTGDAGANTLLGGDGADTLDGGAGADTIDGGAGNDVALGGAGADTVHGGPDHDIVDGGADPDLLRGDFDDVPCTFLFGVASCTGGKDEIRAQDGAVDKIRCGFDADVVKADAADELTEIQPQDVCESVIKPSGSPGPGGGPAPRPAGTLAVTLSGAPKTGRALASRGLRLRMPCTRACAISARIMLGRKVLASGRTKRSSAGTASLTLRVPGRQRRSVARLRRKTLTVAVTRTQNGTRVTGSASLRLR